MPNPRQLERVQQRYIDRYGARFVPKSDRTSEFFVFGDDLYIKTPMSTARIPLNGRHKPTAYDYFSSPLHTVDFYGQPGKQLDFLKCVADIAFYGGAAGGGKSFAIILDALRGVCDPSFNAVLFRRTYPMLKNPGGLIDSARQVYAGFNLGNFNISNAEWLFYSGAKIVFRHLQYDKHVYDYQGAEFSAIYFDELTHFTEFAFDYLTSRRRSPLCKIHPYLRGTTNPQADSWVADRIAWWLDDKTGFPIPERSGKLRWYIREGGETVWKDDPDDFAKYPEAEPLSFTFIPAKLSDNPLLLEGDPGYRATLKAMHPIERDRLLGGNWKVRLEAGTYFQRPWFGIVDTIPDGCKFVRFWDLAATDAKVSRRACYTAGVLLAFDGKTYYIVDVIAERYAPDRVYELILQTAKTDGHQVSIRWEEQPAAAGKFVNHELIALLDGYDSTWQSVSGAKVDRALPWARQASIGRVKLLGAEWNDRILNWFVQFPSDGADVVDAMSGAYRQMVDSYDPPEADPIQGFSDGWDRSRSGLLKDIGREDLFGLL